MRRKLNIDAQYDELIHSHMCIAPLKCLSDWHETVTKWMLKACNLQNATAMSMDVVALMVIGDLVMRMLVLQADELHDPTWTGRFQEQPEHVKAIVCFQVCLLSQKQPC